MKEEREQVTYVMQMNFTSRDQLLQLLQVFGLVGGVVGEGLLDRLVVDGRGGRHGRGP